MSKPKIGLALGSGGIRGLTIIGVIKTLEKHGVKVDYIAGSSIGAIVGGAYAIEKDINAVEKIALKFKYSDILRSISDIGFKTGLVQGNRFLETIRGYIGETKIEDLKIPFTAVATDNETGNAVLLERGSLADAMRASSSIPVFFQPVSISTGELLDGGVSQQVPVEIVKQMGADIIIAVNLSENALTYNRNSNVSSLQHYILLLLKNLAEENCKGANVTISPNFEDISWLNSIKNRKRIIEDGVKATEEKIDRLVDELKRCGYEING